MPFYPSGGGPIPSYIGMVIESTTLDTLSKVQELYGETTTWIQHSGYVLRGGTSDVVANSATKTGGSDDAVVVAHSHTAYGRVLTTNGGGSQFRELTSDGYGTSNVSTSSAGETGTNKNIPNYKSVYIWERTA